MNLTKQEKKQLRAAVIILLVYLAASVFFWLAVRWWAGLIPTAVILLAEYILQVRRHKTFKIPAIVRVYHRLRRLNRVVFPPRKVVVEKNRTVADLCNVVDNIANIKAYDFFVTCIGKGDYSPIGAGSAAQLQNAFNELLSQYYEVRGDERMKLEIKLRLEIGALEVRKEFVGTLALVLKERYSNAAASSLRRLYATYPLTKDTLAHDLSMIAKAEIANDLKYEQKKKQLAKMYGSNAQGPAAKKSEVQNAKAFTATVLAINSALNCKHDIHTITVMEYAIGEQQLQEHINNLKEQGNAGRR